MTADDERLDPPVAVIGYGYWQRRFGGSRDAIANHIIALDPNDTRGVGLAQGRGGGLAQGFVGKIRTYRGNSRQPSTESRT